MISGGLNRSVELRESDSPAKSATLASLTSEPIFKQNQIRTNFRINQQDSIAGAVMNFIISKDVARWTPRLSSLALVLCGLAALAIAGAPTPALAVICTNGASANAGVDGDPTNTACGQAVNTTGGTEDVAIGNNASVSPLGVQSSNAVAIGAGATNVLSAAAGNESVAIGSTNPLTDPQGTTAFNQSIAIGAASQGGGFGGGTRAVAVGVSANARADRATAIGANAQAFGVSSSAFGQAARATGPNSTAIGSGSFATNTGISANDAAIAMGSLATANANGAIAIGGATNSLVTAGQYSVTIGASSSATGQGAIAIGGNGVAGAGATNAFAANSVVIGGQSSASNAAANAVALGQGNTMTAANTVALGSGNTVAQAGAVAIGTGVTTTRANQVAVGTTANTYTLAGVTSAASLAAQTGPVSFITSDAAGNLATSNFNPSNVASVQSVATLQSQFTTLQSQVTSVQNQVFDNRLEARTGTAVALAAGSMPALQAGRRFALSAGYGNFEGANAFGLGATALIYDGKSYAIVGNVGGAFGLERSSAGGRGAVSLQW